MSAVSPSCSEKKTTLWKSSRRIKSPHYTSKKVKLVTAYRSFVAFFIKNQEGLKLLDQEDKLTLREEALKLDELQHENSKLLQTRMKVSQTIMDSIVNLAKNRTKAYSTSYGSQGKYSPLDNSKNAIAINRTL